MNARLAPWRGLIVLACLTFVFVSMGLIGVGGTAVASDHTPTPQAASPTPAACLDPKPGATPDMCTPEASPPPPAAPPPAPPPASTPTPEAAPDCAHLLASIFTSNADGSVNNDNVYPAKEAVYLNGGPESAGTGVPNATRYYQVTAPDGSPLSEVRSFTVSGDGSFRIALAPFATSPNGEYKVLVSTSPAIPRNDCTKSDNFRVTESASPAPGVSATPVPPGPGASPATTSVTTPANTPTIVVPTQAPGCPVTVTIVVPPSHGTAIVGPDGRITYTPNQGFVGTDRFTYRQTDCRGNSAEFLVSVVVTAPTSTAVAPPPNAPPPNAPAPNAPATGSGGNLPGLPNTGLGGSPAPGTIALWATVLLGILTVGAALLRRARQAGR